MAFRCALRFCGSACSLIKSGFQYTVCTMAALDARRKKEWPHELFADQSRDSGSAVVLVGGGAVAARKCPALLQAGARITVIAPELDGRLVELRETG